MTQIELRQFGFTFAGQHRPALHDLSLSIEAGEMVVLCGPSGSGKTTLLRLLKAALAPGGTQSGEILFDGAPLAALSARQQAQQIGFVQQSPEDQIVCDKVWHELAFGLENCGIPSAEIRLRVAEMAAFFGIEKLFHLDTATLSGGQKQLVNLAAVMVLRPTVLLLDEPTAQLDPIAAETFLAQVGKINRELGTTVLLSEHRLETVLAMADRVLALDEGGCAAYDTPTAVGRALRGREQLFCAMPTPMRVYAAVPNELSCPISVRDGRRWLDDFAAQHPIGAVQPRTVKEPADAPVLAAKGLWFRYEQDGRDILRDCSVRADAGEMVAILGGNGAGKSTLLRLLAGLKTPYRGQVLLHGTSVLQQSDRFGKKIGLLPQNPQTLFAGNTVREDLERAATAHGLTTQAVAQAVALCELEGLLERHPYDLSGGEQQRAALAHLLLQDPAVLLLDEPTNGMDAAFRLRLAGLLRRLCEQGKTIVMVSHDVEFCAAFADRCVLLFDGAPVADATPDAFFSAGSFYTTAAARMARSLLPGAVTTEQVIAACGGTPPTPPKRRQAPPESAPSAPPPIVRQTGKTPWAALICLILIPLTVALLPQYLGTRRYLLLSMLVLAEALVPFLAVFEGRRHGARDLAVLAVVIGLAVAGRAAFFMTPQFKPVAAVVIIGGAAFGAENGFLIGALSMLASNLLFGQGPWTPWQMLAMGLIGFFAGLLFAGRRARPRLLAVFGFCAVLLLYGGILNPASLLMYQTELTRPMLVTAYLSGLPFDLIHAAGTAVFLLLLARPLLDKLQRVQVKYRLTI